MELDRERVSSSSTGPSGSVDRCIRVEPEASSEEHDCTNVLDAAGGGAREASTGLMAEVLEDHIRLHLLGTEGQGTDAGAWRGTD